MRCDHPPTSLSRATHLPAVATDCLPFCSEMPTDTASLSTEYVTASHTSILGSPAVLGSATAAREKCGVGQQPCNRRRRNPGIWHGMATTAEYAHGSLQVYRNLTAVSRYFRYCTGARSRNLLTCRRIILPLARVRSKKPQSKSYQGFLNGFGDIARGPPPKYPS